MHKAFGVSKTTQILRAIIALAICSITSSVALAQVTVIDSDGDKQPNIYRMTVSPAPEPKPALKYHFLVPPVDQIHANAATLYYKAMSIEEERVAMRQFDEALSNDEKYDQLYSGPLDRFPQKEAEGYVRWLDAGYFDSIREAARCSHCDWMDDIRQRGISTTLPQAQSSRQFCNLLALRARLQVAQNKLEEAVDTLLAGYAWSRNLGHSPTLVQCLIGMAFQGVLDEQAATLIAAENSPNLYWAFTDLAEHPVDLRQALSYESRLLEFTFHSLAEIDRRIFTPEEALQLANKDLPDITNRGDHNIVNTLLWALELQPEARKYLLEHGYTVERLDAMPVLQEVMLYRWRQFEVICDDYFKWLMLPDNEVADGFSRSYGVMRATELEGKDAPFTSLLPAVQAASYARYRTMRFTNMLRIVEALRMYAAEHGRWPERLADITSVPVPVDPFSKKPFQYSVKDGVATIDPPADAELPGGAPASRRYELKLRKANAQ